MKTDFSGLIDYITTQYWAMNPIVLEQMVDIFERHCNGPHPTTAEIEAVTQAKRGRGTDTRTYQVTSTGTAIIPVSGVLAKHSRMVNGCSQPRGTSIEALREQFRAAMDDRAVNAIFLHIESPGGSVDGVADFADEVYQAGFEKPVIAFADELAASAAYFIGSQANRFYANQTAGVGSIGVYTVVVDSSKAAENIGLKFHIIRSGDHKGVGSAGVKVTEENIGTIQERINVLHSIFTNAVLRGRADAGLSGADLAKLADGQVHIGNDAVQRNLVDAIMTFDEALAAELPKLRGEQKATGASAGIDVNVKDKESTMSGKNQASDVAVDSQATERILAADRIQIAKINEVLSADCLVGIRTKAIAGGTSVEAAKAEAFDVMSKHYEDEIVARDEQLAAANKKLEAIAAGGPDVVAGDPVDAEEETGTVSGDDGKAETYTAAVEQFESKGLSKAKAMAEAARKFPKSHEAWKGEHPSRERE